MSLRAEGARELLQQLCADLRLLRAEAGGPSLRVLGERLRIGKSQLGAILNGQVREPPDWRVVRGLVDSFLRHAQEHGRTGRLSLPTGLDEFWTYRYAMVEHAFDQAARRRTEESPAAVRAEPAPAVPRQLPAAVRQFVGREAELMTLTALLTRDAGAAPTLVISAIGGTAGVGKPNSGM